MKKMNSVYIEKERRKNVVYDHILDTTHHASLLKKKRQKKEKKMSS
jgi:hypothetical protein